MGEASPCGNSNAIKNILPKIYVYLGEYKNTKKAGVCTIFYFTRTVRVALHGRQPV